VSADEKFVEAKMTHYIDLILRHPAIRIVAMVGQPARLAAVAIAAQIGRNYGEIFGQPRRNKMPVHVRQRVTMQQQQRWSFAAHDAVNAALRIAGLDIELAKTFVHFSSPFH